MYFSFKTWWLLKIAHHFIHRVCDCDDLHMILLASKLDAYTFILALKSQIVQHAASSFHNRKDMHLDDYDIPSIQTQMQQFNLEVRCLGPSLSNRGHAIHQFVCLWRIPLCPPTLAFPGANVWLGAFLLGCEAHYLEHGGGICRELGTTPQVCPFSLRFGMNCEAHAA